MAEDEKQNQLAQAWVSYLATRPLGVSYFGVSDRVTPNLIMILQSLASKIKQKTNKPINFTSGSKIITGPNTAQNAIATQLSTQQNAKPVEILPKTETKSTQSNTMVLTWKQYLKNKNMYNGDPLDSNIDNSFKQSMLLLDNKLSNIIPTTKGMVWNGSNVGKGITPEEYESAYKLAENFKKKKARLDRKEFFKRAQPTLDDLGPPPTVEERPNATNFVINQDAANQPQHPWLSQHNGVQVNKLPSESGEVEKLDDDIRPSDEDIIEANQGIIGHESNNETSDDGATNTNIDDRMMSLIDLIEKTEKN